MARRKQDLANKLTPERSKRPGWADTVTGQPASTENRRPTIAQPEPEPDPADILKRKTYLLYPDMIQEIEALADQERVGISELVRYLLGAALDQVYNRQLGIPTQPGRRHIGE